MIQRDGTSWIMREENVGHVPIVGIDWYEVVIWEDGAIFVTMPLIGSPFGLNRI